MTKPKMEMVSVKVVTEFNSQAIEGVIRYLLDEHDMIVDRMESYGSGSVMLRGVPRK